MNIALRSGFVAVVLFLLGSFALKAATVKGLVVDKQSSEPLVGAVVFLDGTKYGTSTGLDGSYIIKNVPAGSYTLKIRFSSFNEFEQAITLKDNEDITVNAPLELKTNVLKAVQVTGKLKTGSDEEARHKEKNADEVMNIMSARTIELLPDITVANVLQRVSGVQMQRDNTGEGRYAIIRGMDKRYNYTTVNGVKIPSPDDKARYVPMDIFPAEIIDRLEVIKTLTPGMEGDAVGGVMNLAMKDAPDHFVLYASAATGYNQTLLDRKYSQFNSSVINSKDPFEVHGHSYLPTQADFTRGNSNFTKINPKPNDLYSFTIGNRFLKDKKFGIVFAGSYQNTYKGTDEIQFQPSSQPAPNNVLALTDLLIRKYDKQETRTGVHTKLDYRFNKKNEISLYALFLELDERESRYTIDTTVAGINRTGAGTGPVAITNRSALRKQNILNATLQGKHVLANRLKFDWTGAVSQATRDVPDMAEIHTETGAMRDGSGNQVVLPEIIKSWKHSWENTKDKDAEGFANLTYTPTIFGKDVEFVGGGMYRHKDRSNDYYAIGLQPTSSNEPFTNIFNAQFNMEPNAPSSSYTPYNLLTYTVTENISAYYAQAKILFWDRLQLLTGVRMEHTYLHYTIAQNPNVFVGQNGTYDYSDLLPSVHLKYQLSDKQNLRLSYFSSISRPGFFEVVPYTFPGENYDEIGNYNLVHSTANNFDARYEWFPKGIDQVLVGAFYKSITNPIEYGLINTSTSSQAIQPINQKNSPATNVGGEIVLTKYFHYFGVSLNYTYTNSSIIDSIKTYYTVPGPGGHDTIKNGRTTEKRPLQGQASNIGNIALIYKNPVLGLDAHIALAYTGRHIAYVSPYPGLDYWQKGLALFDFSCEKKIAKHFSVYAKVNNILNTPTVLESLTSKNTFLTGSYSLPYQTLPSTTLLQRDYYGRNYLIGIRYKID